MLGVDAGMLHLSNRIAVGVGGTRCLLLGGCSGRLGKTLCERLVQAAPDTGRVIEATFVPAGPVPVASGPPGATAPAPDHCLVRGKIDERIGVDGKPYAIGYEVRLPAKWNGKFLFEGGGGSDGVLRPALDVIPFGAPKPERAVRRLCDRHHGRRTSRRPGPLGPYLFGLDPKARADKGYSSIPPVVRPPRRLSASSTARHRRAPICRLLQRWTAGDGGYTALPRDVRRRRRRLARLSRTAGCDRRHRSTRRR